MNTELTEHDGYLHAARALPIDRALTIVDVGANVGWTAVRALDVFPGARVFAFEPVPEVYEELQTRARERSGIRPINVAVGDRTGVARMTVTRNRWCSSLLDPTPEGVRAHAGDYDPERTIETPLTTLDAWASREGVEAVDLLKLDVQGSELSALRGAEALLRAGVGAILAEAQIASEYEGAATLTDIDAYLRSLGYTLSHLLSAGCAGPDRATTHVDALWLHPSARRRLLESPAFSFVPSPVERLKLTLTQAAARGETRVALYGAGRYTRDALPKLGSAAGSIIAVADDNPDAWGGAVAGVPIVDPRTLAGLGAQVLVMSSDAHEDALWSRALSMDLGAIRPVRLYTRQATAAFAAGHAPGVQTITSSGSSPAA